ncbi:IS630 family transposase [Romboutsia sp.]|uniref:IS630 family transposase n=1 Tax=Romboutsia sp. TaxID=1965302 RepID=UPI003F36F6F7
MIRFENDVDINDKIKEVKVALKNEKNLRMYKRYSVLLKHLQGINNKEIGKMELLEPHTVGLYIKKYAAGGLDALKMNYNNCGQKRKLSPEQEENIKKVITEKIPEEVGFENRCNWTIALVKEYIKDKFNIDMALSSVHVVMIRLGLSHTRPTYVLAKVDKAKQEKFKEDFEVLKKILDGEVQHIVFEDESMIRDYQAMQKTWFPKGKQRKIRTYGKNPGVKIIGILDYNSGSVYCEEHKNYDAEVFLGFLKKVLEKYPTGKTIMILDNARIHHAKLIQPFLSDNKHKLELMFLPPYSLELNLIEGLWGWLKSNVINNKFFASLEEVRVSIDKFIESINKVPINTLARLCTKL